MLDPQVEDDAVVVSVSRDSGMLFMLPVERKLAKRAFATINLACDLAFVPPTVEARGAHVSLALAKLISFYDTSECDAFAEDGVMMEESDETLMEMSEIACRVLYVAEANDPGVMAASEGLHAAIDGLILTIRGFDDPDDHDEFIEMIEVAEEEGRTVTMLN